MEITVTQFKAKCLGIFEKVQREKCSVVISRHGKPAVELRPVSPHESGSLFGRSKGETLIRGDLTSTGETWNADS